MLTDKEKEQLRAGYRTDLSRFIQRSFSIIDPNANYLHNWHIDLIAEYLRACQTGEITRLIINVPPRFLKSISVSVAFPAWLLGHNPSEQITCVSYSGTLAKKHSSDTLAIMCTDWYKSLFPETKLVIENQLELRTEQRGFRVCTSTMGTLTGMGGNFILVDDPLSQMQAHSMTERDKCQLWFNSLSNRLNDKNNGCIIVIMQRLHSLDTSGILLEQGGWEHLKLPLIAEQDEVLKCGKIKVIRKEGELLHKERMGQEAVDRSKRELGAYAFSGEMQQNPSPTGGGEFKKDWMRFYKGKLSASAFNNYILVDPANSKRKQSDYTSMCVVGLGADKNLYVLDWVRDKLNLREREDALFDLHLRWKPKYVLYEKYGMMVDADVMRNAMDQRNYRFTITEVAGKLSKEDRIRRLIPYFADGRVWFPNELIRATYEGVAVDLVQEFIHQEYLTFPVGVHDDMIDSLSRIFDANLIWPGDSQVDYYSFYRNV